MSSGQLARSLLRARLSGGSRERNLGEEGLFTAASPTRRLAVAPPAARSLALGSSPPSAARAHAPAWQLAGSEAAKELFDILSSARGDDGSGLPCSPPARAGNPLPLELCRRYEALQPLPTAGPLRSVPSAGPLRVVGFQPQRYATSL